MHRVLISTPFSMRVAIACLNGMQMARGLVERLDISVETALKGKHFLNMM